MQIFDDRLCIIIPVPGLCLWLHLIYCSFLSSTFSWDNPKPVVMLDDQPSRSWIAKDEYPSSSFLDRFIFRPELIYI